MNNDYVSYMFYICVRFLYVSNCFLEKVILCINLI